MTKQCDGYDGKLNRLRKQTSKQLQEAVNSSTSMAETALEAHVLAVRQQNTNIYENGLRLDWTDPFGDFSESCVVNQCKKVRITVMYDSMIVHANEGDLQFWHDRG